jgi:RNA polymerase sigma factor (sigma-70 family)
MRTRVQGPCSGAFIHQLERLFEQGTAVGISEGELLERFVAARDEAAFEALIARHGPMVLGVCRHLLRDPNDVDDAFQATFLVLVRKAGSLRRRDLLGNWLYGVAHRVATRSRCLAARRLARAPHGQETLDRLDEHGGEAIAVHDDPSPIDSEPSPWLHEEVRRLPERDRSLVLLCYFEGLTHEQAAARLGWPIGTVKGRLARARDRLRKGLSRRGITVPDAALASRLALLDALTAVPEPLKGSTLAAARSITRPAAARIVAGAAVSRPVATLADGVSRAMITTQVKAVSLVLLVAGLVTTGFVIAAAQGVPDQDSAARPDPFEPRIGGPRRVDKAKVAGPQAPPPKAERLDPSIPAKGGEEVHIKGAPGVGEPAGAGAGMAGMMEGGGSDDAGYELQARLDITRVAAVLAAAGQNAPNDALVQELDLPWEMAFSTPTPLQDVLKYIKTTIKKAGRPPLPIYVDPKGLKDAGVTLTSPVVLELEGVPLKSALRLMLKQLNLAFCVRDGVLVISSFDGIREELLEAATEIYSRDADQLEKVIRSIHTRLGGQ